MHTDINTNNATNSAQTTSEDRSYLNLSLLEQRVYKMTHKQFARIDTEAKELEDNISSLTKKLSLLSSEIELESIKTKIDESDIKLKNIKRHPLHQKNRKQFLGELATSYSDYVQEIELVDEKDPYMTLTLTINGKENKIAMNSAALESLFNDSDKPSTITITLPEETSPKQVTQCLTLIGEYLTTAQVKTFDQHTLPIIELLMKAEDNDKQIALAKAMGRSIEEQFFDALQEENTLKMERIASSFESDTLIAKDTKICLTFKTQGEWINKKLERILDATHIDKNQKRTLIEKVLNDYKTIRQDDNTFSEAFTTFQATGFAATPFLYRALNQYDSNSKIRFDLIDKQDEIKEGQYTFTCPGLFHERFLWILLTSK